MPPLFNKPTLPGVKLAFSRATLGFALLFCAWATKLPGASFQDDFAVVFIDAATEAKLGAFPLNRSFLAGAVRKAGELGAKGVVIKFFLDQPREESGDQALAMAMTNLPVILQARIDDTEAHPNPLPDRFTWPEVKVPTEISGVSGWIPLPAFSARARDVGFVDFSSPRVPLLETYQSRTVKSLVVCCIELAKGKPAVLTPNRRLNFGVDGLRLDGTNCLTAAYPLKDDLPYLPFHQFLAGEIPASRIKGKVVIIGYDGPGIHSEPTPIGSIRAHRFFVYILQNMYEKLGP